MKDYYETLGVSRSASPDEIKKAYRNLAKRYHPDRHKGDKAAEEKFKGISEAYDVLGDPKKRQQFDQFGRWTHAGRPSAPGGGSYRTYTWTSGGAGPDFGDIFSEIFGMGGMGGGGQTAARSRGGAGFNPFAQAQQTTRGGEDIHYTMDIDFMEAVNGSSAKISVNRGGRTSKLNIKIPAGVKDGQKIRLAGKGIDGGDLFISLKVRPHENFRREGNDIFIDLPLSITEAILGCKVDVPTLKGPVSLKVPPGTSSGAKLRLKGQGVSKGKTRGDFYALVKIVLPKKIDNNLKQLAEEMAEKVPYEAREGRFAK